jgi:hypothetical protein
MNDREYRISVLAALPLLLLAVFGLLIEFSFQLAAFVAAAMLSASFVGVWRCYICWTGLRSTSTIALGVLMLAQTIAWKPILATTTCGHPEEIQLFGQTVSGAGLWCTFCCLIWWGNHLISDLSESRKRLALIGRKTMTRELARLAIGMSIILFLFGLFFVIVEVLSIGLNVSDRDSVLLAYEICALVAVTSWLLLWRRRVNWTSSRLQWTAIFAAAFLLSPLALLLPTLGPQGPSSSGFLRSLPYFLPLILGALWFAGTAYVWKDKRPERSTGAGLPSGGVLAACPQCSYDLTGLREVRCPECGWTSTIDDVVRRSLDDWAAASDLTV